mmetsp:Transcript_23834/g.70387  ORF Transcript_23834/g.70387 Transcript_23834/m.70387 type:complete len:442 (-) Transcript_23834:35-1360(-)
MHLDRNGTRVVAHVKAKDISAMKLIDLARRARWAALSSRALSHPQEIFDVDENLFTALHWACFNQPDLRAVRAICMAFARLDEDRSKADEDEIGGRGRTQKMAALLGNVALMTDKDEGMTALHAACCSHASVEVIFELVRHCPAAIMVQDRSGWTPLHFACHTALSVMEEAEANYTIDVVRVLIDAEPQVVICEDCHGNSALECFVSHFGNLVKNDWTYGGRVQSKSAHQWFWSVILLLINEMVSQCHHRNISKALPSSMHDESRKLLQGGRDVPIIRQIAMLPPMHVARELIPYVAAKFPAQLKEPDSAGNLALHIAAGAYCIQGKGDICGICSDNSETNRALIDAYPRAVMTQNSSNQLPITAAIQGGISWKGGIRALLEVHPEGIQSCAVDCKLYPHLLEQVARGCGDAATGVLFKILRSKPNLVQGCPLKLSVLRIC